MLKACFSHLSGVGPILEAKLRAAGILCWRDVLTLPLPCGPVKARSILLGVEESVRRLGAGNARWFGDALLPAQQWLLFPLSGTTPPMWI